MSKFHVDLRSQAKPLTTKNTKRTKIPGLFFVTFARFVVQSANLLGNPLGREASGIMADMIELNIPGRGTLQLEHLVLDVNGTLAKDGRLLERMPRLLAALKDRLTLHLLTADTHGRQANIDVMLNLHATRLQAGNEAGQKGDYVRALGAEKVVAIGQGANDAEMLKAAAIGIAVMNEEGLAVEALLNADIVTSSIYDALNLLEFPMRLIATLRR
jgi:soluble P-type ATPase